MIKREISFDALQVRGTIDDLHNKLCLYFEDDTVMYSVLGFLANLEESDCRAGVLRAYADFLKLQWRDEE